ncbi:hypothetical protein WOLCODRAFT_134829 [Wolfiporia cocos MD-104 SS10]|uniref:L-lactate dehydrogenase (cytochrome) n=1 Tax=Wolfiporia cocos (strain MD-104) TaxID=742152 RepID=A0A2H3ITE3_WOLCO|nr:hypothetical protein WOLCODRAFT_134829 [Wolfiporia cocos MD-104 SS10]
MSRTWSLDEVSKHNTTKSCWVIIKNKVYDVTEFLPEHPGGSSIILKYAGRDATAAYEPIHPPDALHKNLPAQKHLGTLDTQGAETLKKANEQRRKTKDEIRVEQAQKKKPPVSRILSVKEMEDVALRVLSFKAAAYYSTGADDEITLSENARAFSRFFFRPRVLRPISSVDPSTTILGFQSSLPIFVSGTGLAKLGHPLGEANITRGCGRTALIQMVSTYASLSASEVAAARLSPAQPLFFQLYKHADDARAAALLREIETLGYNAVFLTVDAPVAGNRERDVRAPFELEAQEREIEAEARGVAETEGLEGEPEMPDQGVDEDDGGTATPFLNITDHNMTFEKTIPWLRRNTKLPIVLKGIQCVEDAVLAAEAGVDGILLSNHGGRQLEYSPPPLEVLYQLRQQRPDVFDKLEVYVDGGVRRGTDVLKALCLGAKAVGLGRAFLYAQSAYGEAGVVQVARIMQREIVLGMRLLGVTSVSELRPELVERIDWQPSLPRAKL